MQELTVEQKIFTREVKQVERKVRQVERQLFPSMALQTDSLDEDQASSSVTATAEEGRRRPSLLRRTSSFLRRSMDDSHIMENTSSLSLLMKEARKEEEGQQGLLRHSNHQPGLRLVSWDEEDDRDRREEEEREEERDHHPKTGLLLRRGGGGSKKKKKTQASSSSRLPQWKKPKELTKYVQSLPRDHYLTPLRRSSRPPSPSSSSSSMMMGSRSLPAFSPSPAYLLKRPVLPADEGKPSYARSTSSSRHGSGAVSPLPLTSSASVSTAALLSHNPLLRLDGVAVGAGSGGEETGLPLLAPKASLPALTLHLREGKPHLVNL